MIKIQTYLSVVTLSFVLSLSQISHAKTLKTFNHSYQGVVTGQTDKRGMINQLGQPIRVQKTSNGYNYIYKNAKVNISGKKSTVNSITLYQQNPTRDANGIKVGDPISKINRLGDTSGQGNWSVDNRHGIIYWHNGSKIVKIVLPAAIGVN